MRPRGLLLTLFILLACGDRNVNWTLYDVKGHLPDLKFSLPGAGGKTVSSDDLKGKTVLLFFGYASCPDICPTTMAQLTAVLQNLGDKARDVRIVFVSVDPHRDTPDILQAYVDAFNKNAMGVTGDEKQIADWRAATASPTRSKAQARRRRRDLRCDAQPRRVHFRQQGPRALLASETDSIEALTRDIRQLIDMTS